MNTNNHEFLLEPLKTQNTRKNTGWRIVKFLWLKGSSAFNIHNLELVTNA